MHEAADSTAENRVALENTGEAAPAHPDGIAAREWDDTAGNRRGVGSFVEHGEPGAYGLRSRRHQSAQAEAVRRTPAPEHDARRGEGAAGALCQGGGGWRDVEHPRSQAGL